MPQIVEGKSSKDIEMEAIILQLIHPDLKSPCGYHIKGQ